MFVRTKALKYTIPWTLWTTWTTLSTWRTWSTKFTRVTAPGSSRLVGFQKCIFYLVEVGAQQVSYYNSGGITHKSGEDFQIYCGCVLLLPTSEKYCCIFSSIISRLCCKI